MLRQPPLARCFVALCFSSAVILAVVEWRDPFPKPASDPVVTGALATDILSAKASSAPLEKTEKTETTPSPATAEWPHLPNWLSGRSSGSLRDDLPAPPAKSSVQLSLSLSSRTLEVRTPNEAPITYKVAIGQDDWQTPAGNFQVTHKLENPAWQHPITHETIEPGPDNPLGTRWIGFWSNGQAEIGFHGTNQEELIGEAVSHGCVRMRNQDIEALYERVEVGTSVQVMP